MNKVKFNKFVANTQTVLDKCELSKYIPFKDQDIWKITSGLNQNECFVLKKDAISYYFNGLEYVKEKFEESSIQVSESYVENFYLELIKEQKKARKNLKDNCRCFLDKVTLLTSKSFRFIFPLDQYDHKEDLIYEKIKVVKLTDDILKKYFYDNENEILQNMKTLVECNETEFFVIVDVESIEEKYAEEKAYLLVERFLNGIKVFDPSSDVNLRRHTMKKITEFSLLKINNNTDHIFRNYNLKGKVLHDNEFHEKLQPYWTQLMIFLFSDKLNPLQEVILYAIYWFGQTNPSDSKIKNFLNLITGLEIIVLHTSSDSKKADTFGKRCSKIFAEGETDWNFWRDLYRKRNDLIHQKFVDVHQYEIDTLQVSLRKLILQLIECSRTYENVTNVFKQKYDL